MNINLQTLNPKYKEYIYSLLAEHYKNKQNESYEYRYNKKLITESIDYTDLRHILFIGNKSTESYQLNMAKDIINISAYNCKNRDLDIVILTFNPLNWLDNSITPRCIISTEKGILGYLRSIEDNQKPTLLIIDQISDIEFLDCVEFIDIFKNKIINNSHIDVIALETEKPVEDCISRELIGFVAPYFESKFIHKLDSKELSDLLLDNSANATNLETSHAYLKVRNKTSKTDIPSQQMFK